MDITRDILYRNFYFNNGNTQAMIHQGAGVGDGLQGCTVESVDYSDVDIVQFVEKKALQDGMDAGDVYLGARRVRMTGTLYDLTRALLFDSLQEMRAAMSPRLAQAESPADKGYLPLYFSVPTNRVEDYPAGAIDLQVYAMPRGFRQIIQRSKQGGDDANALAIPWQAMWVQKDPRVLGELPVDQAFTGGQTSGSGNLVNRGDYNATLNALFEVTGSATVITLSMGGSNFTLTVPVSTNNRIIRVKGDDKIVTVEELGVESLAMSVIAFQNSTTWPVIPTGISPWTFSANVTSVVNTSHFWFWEAFA